MSRSGAAAIPAPLLRSSQLGLWVFLASEIVLFGGMIGSYVLRRLGNPEWAEAARHLSVGVGTTNTLILLTSSLTMILALVAAGRGRAAAGRGFLLATVLLGAVFLGIKGFEWSGEIGAGRVPAAGGFWSFYYTMTGLHALHVLAGVLINSVLLLASLAGSRRLLPHRLDAAGLYWHFVDIVWIFLFPLLYLS